MSRPIGITLIAILQAVYGVFAILGGVAGLLVVGGALDALITVIFGAALIYLAWGLWTLRSWAWLSTLIIEGLNGLFALFAIFVAPFAVFQWFTLFVAVVIVLYLLRPRVRAVFERRSSSAP